MSPMEEADEVIVPSSLDSGLILVPSTPESRLSRANSSSSQRPDQVIPSTPAMTSDILEDDNNDDSQEDPCVSTILPLVTNQAAAEHVLRALKSKFPGMKTNARQRKSGRAAEPAPQDAERNVSAPVKAILQKLEMVSQESSTISALGKFTLDDSMLSLLKTHKGNTENDITLAKAKKTVRIALAIQTRGTVESLFSWVMCYVFCLGEIRALFLPLSRHMARSVLLRTSVQGSDDFNMCLESQFKHIFGENLGSRKFSRLFKASRTILRLVHASKSYAVLLLLGAAGFSIRQIACWTKATIKAIEEGLSHSPAIQSVLARSTSILGVHLNAQDLKPYHLTSRLRQSDLTETVTS